MFRPFIYLILFLTGMWALNVFCAKQTDGFFPYQIPLSLPKQDAWNTSPLTAMEKTRLDEILAQSFSYFGKGHQCFAFESEDGKYILKLPFHSQLIPPLWLRPIPFFSEIYRAKQMHKKQRKLHQDKMSYFLAFEKLREETGLVYIHLNRTDALHGTLKVTDKIGVQHLIALDHVEFILQKKADHLYPTIDKWMRQDQAGLAKHAISQLIRLFAERYALGIKDQEKVLNTNYGFLDGHPMQIDIGRLRVCNPPPDKATQAIEIWGVFEPLVAYLETAYPELALHLAQEKAHY